MAMGKEMEIVAAKEKVRKVSFSEWYFIEPGQWPGFVVVDQLKIASAKREIPFVP